MQRSVIGTQARTNAFTLLEILVLIVIVTIILMIALIAFGDFGATRRQQLIVLQLKSSMNAARLNAILTSTVLGLAFTPHGYRYYQYHTNTQTDYPSWLPLTHDTLSNPHAFHAHTRWSLVTPLPSQKNEPRLYFLPDGTVTPFTLTITFRNGLSYKIFRTTSGEVQIVTQP